MKTTTFFTAPTCGCGVSRCGEYDAAYNIVSVLQLTGMKAEVDGDVERAIQCYAEAIETGDASMFDLLHAYHHAYNRIIALLSRIRDYRREASFIERLMTHNILDSERKRLVSRLEVIELKIS